MNIEDLNGIDVNIDEIQYIIDKYRSGQNTIVVTGEFSSGKSSFINCFVNRRVFLPYGKTECTPVLIDVCEGKEGKIEVKKTDGTIFEVENSKENIFKYAKYEEDEKQDILSICIPIVESGLPQGTHLIDTPGTNTVIKEHEDITRYIIKKADAVLYLFNKVISKSDIVHINNILSFTSNIIFILTHSDEIDSKTSQKYTKNRIDELMSEAKNNISSGTCIERDDLLMCNVGSIDGFDNREEIEEIKSLLVSYVESQTKERRKKVAQNKIEKILQDALDNYSIKSELLKKQKTLDEATLQTKIKKFEKDQSFCEKEHTNRIDKINRRIEQQEEICKGELSRLLMDEKKQIISFISTEDINEINVERKINQLNRDISSKMRVIIEEAITAITKEAYESANASFESINQEFDISTPLLLTTPDIEELDDSRIVARLYSVERQIEDNLRELSELKKNSSEEEVLDLEKKIRECENQKEAVVDKLSQLGAYRPEFITVENEGGENVGRVTGRVIGEVADLALLLWNPAGAAAGVTKGAGAATKAASETAKVVNVADKAKDAATIFRYLKTAAGKAAETGKEVNEKKEKIKKVVTTIKKVDDGRREIIERVQENAEESGNDGITLSMMLDMLSIGHWTEKIGGAIGEVIKPTTTTSIENLDVKAEYENRRREIIEENSKLNNDIFDLKNHLNEINDFGKQRRIETEIREKIKVLEEKKTELEEMKKKSNKSYMDEQIRNNLNKQIDNYESSQLEKGVRLIRAILGEAKIQIIERVTTDYCEKLDYYKDTILKLQEESISGSSEMVEYEDKIDKISNCISDIRTWLE